MASDKSHTTSNALPEPIELDEDAFAKAIAMLKGSEPVDYVKSIGMSPVSLKLLDTSSGVLKVGVENQILGSMTFGIEIVENKMMPDGWALIGHKSGKKTMLRLSDGHTFEVPDVTRI